MEKQGLNGHSETTKKLINQSGLSVEQIKEKGLDEIFLKLKKMTATDKEAANFIKELFQKRLTHAKIIELIGISAYSSDF